MKITELALFPVKSMGGEDRRQLTFEARGAIGDRVWAVLTADGRLGSGKTNERFRRLEGLLHCSARSGDLVPLVTLPDGSEHPADSEELARRLSEQVDEPVTLGVEGDAPHHDDAPVHVLATGALEDLGVRLGAPADRRRARANVLIDAAADELGSGQRIALGEAGPVLRIGDPMPRCVMVGMSQGPGPRGGALSEDRRVLRALQGEQGPQLGFMAFVERTGTATVGDLVTILPSDGV